ncbi:hypothetical protein C8R43DRAFT_1143470 [Mycena crocata]|nr:hypothetical protein C8R43DRAFT_1143470 [Mycena crocata]
MGVAALLTGNGEIIAVHFRAKVAAEIYFLRIPCDGEATVGVNSFKATQVEHLCGLQPESLLNSLQVQIRFKFLFELTSFGGWIDFDAFKVGRTGLSVSVRIDFDAFKVGRRDRIITYWFMISHRELVVKVNLLRRVFDMSLKGLFTEIKPTALAKFGLKAASGDVVFREPRMPLWFRIQNKPLRYTYLQMYRVRLPAVGISVIGSLRAGAQSRREDEARDVFSHFSTPLIVWLRKSSRPSLPVSCSDFERSGLGLKSTRHGFPLTRVKPAAARLAFRMFRTKGRATSSFEWNRRRGLVRSGSSSGDAKSPVRARERSPARRRDSRSTQLDL